MQDYCVGLWSLNVGIAPVNLHDFVQRIEQRMKEGAGQGIRLLMMPEYSVEACLAFKPDHLTPAQEMAFLAKTGAELVEAVRPLVRQYNISVLLGSMPVPCPGGHTNTAILLSADGREIRQDKLSLTPGEQDPDSWHLSGGNVLGTFELDGLKMAILICLDVEMPAHSCLLAREKLDLLLVPSMTAKLSGYHRVYDCAKARAVELMTSVAVCGVVGAAKGTTQNETNVSGAALYVPCEEELGFTGCHAHIEPVSGEKGEDPLLVTRVPVEIVRNLHATGPEVWPGAWSADHIQLKSIAG